MPDPACPYTLTSTFGTINFNDGSANQYYITEIPTGLSGAPISFPVDAVPFTDGSLSYVPFRRGSHIQVEGIFLITSTRVMNNIETIRNQMEQNLKTILIGCGVPTSFGSFSGSPPGGSSFSATVKNDTPLECVHDQGYLVRTFTFGLFSDQPL